MTSFVLRSPKSAADAVALLAANPQARAIGGGTDLVPNLRRGIGAPDQLIDLSGIDELQYLSAADLGALITSVHRMGQKSLPFLVFGAGLPQLAALATTTRVRGPIVGRAGRRIDGTARPNAPMNPSSAD